MRIVSLSIRNFKSIKSIEINDIESAFIIVGKNSVGKTVILDAIRAAAGQYAIKKEDFNTAGSNIEIGVRLEITRADLALLNKYGVVSHYKRYTAWEKDFKSKLPSYAVESEDSEGVLSFTYIANAEGKIRYFDGFKKDNRYIPEVFPTLHFISHERELTELQRDIFLGDRELKLLSDGNCMFDVGKKCDNCFQCIGMIENKKASELSIFEAARLFQYKLTRLDMQDFLERLNNNFIKNGGRDRLILKVDDTLMRNAIPQVYVENEAQGFTNTIAEMGEGLKSMYILSLLETYAEDEDRIPCIIMIEDPESYLHPQLQKNAGGILYKLSKKNQVIFSTHSPNMIFNFNSRQIKQVYIGDEGYTQVREKPDIDRILNDLGYSANDLMNVSFVFFVEGKQDESRLPLLLRKYYGETYDEDGQLRRVAIIATNSCTNIKTYANLKYINKLYIKDQFLMIRDGDAKDADELKRQLCGYYRERGKADKGNLPRVTEKNVLILKYYSFENYFLDPEIMTRIGVVKSVDQFYDILYSKYREYLFKLKSMKNMCERLGITIDSREDIIANMENIRMYVRGHNLYDIFYGRYKGECEREILNRYIEEADRDAFKDILDAIDSFVYFENKKTDSSEA